MKVFYYEEIKSKKPVKCQLVSYTWGIVPPSDNHLSCLYEGLLVSKFA